MYLVLAVNVLFAACCLPRIARALILKSTVDVKPDFSFQELWDLEKTFWDTFLYPANLKQVNGTGDTSVFAADTPDILMQYSGGVEVQGRVDITRTFDGRELNSEYIFGLFSEPDHVSLVGVPLAYNITEFTANQNIASATTVIIFNSTTFGLILPVTIDTWIEWNAERKIIQYDATFRWFDYAVATLFEAAARKLNTTDSTAVQAATTKLLSTTICQTHESYCTGENQQYKSTEVCLDFLTNKIRFGQPYELGRNTLFCREVHEHMVKYRPDVHCAHIGPTGGNYCVDDQSYQMVVMNKYFMNSYIPYGYGADQNIWLAGN